jgi:large subunit ribosomal protein L28
MAKRCEVLRQGSGRRRTVSHAHNVGPRRFEPNLQTVRAVIKGATKRSASARAACAAAKSRKAA